MATELTTIEWVEILQNEEITKPTDLEIFQTMYDFPNQAASASQVGIILGSKDKKPAGRINLNIWRLAERISKDYDINLSVRKNKKYKYWDLFFNGWDEGSLFIWQLKPELKTALEETELTGEECYPEEIVEDKSDKFYEGLKRSISINKFERNTTARRKCIEHWSSICSVCDFDFEKKYGDLGKGFIHVHHLIPISEIGQRYQVDPINDLRPVCPNCHSMLHKENPPMTIDELKREIKKHDPLTQHRTQ